MAITISDKTQIRVTTDFDAPQNMHAIPVVAKVAMTNPGPVSVDAVGANGAGQAQVVQATHATRLAYVGYNTLPSRAAGQACGVIRNGIVDGFTGVTPGSPVYVDTTSADNSGTSSGLTHTAPTTVINDTVTNGSAGETVTTALPDQPIGVGLTATKILFY